MNFALSQVEQHLSASKPDRRAAERAETSADDLLEVVVFLRATAELLYDLAQNDHAELVRIPVLLAASQNLTRAADCLERAKAC
jgi:hypothetical protein